MLSFKQMQTEYSAFLQGTNAAASLKTPPVNFPVFYMTNLLRTRPDYTPQPITSLLPFPDMCIVSESANGFLGTNVNIFIIVNGGVAAFCQTPSLSPLFKPTCMFDLSDPANGHAVIDQRALWETVPEVRHCLNQIARLKLFRPAAYTAGQRQKARGKIQLAPFILMQPVATAPTPHKGGTHASPTPHNRKAYQRVMKKSGKIVQVRASKVLGGSTTPRAYKVV